MMMMMMMTKKNDADDDDVDDKMINILSRLFAYNFLSAPLTLWRITF